MDLAAALVAVEEHADLLRGKPGERGEPGEAGKSIKGERGLVGPAGKSIRGSDGRDGRDGMDGRNGIDGPPGRDGKSITGAPGKDGVGPDERVRISKDDPKAGFLADKLTAGVGIEIRTASGKRGERLVIDATAQGGPAGGSAGIIAYDDGVAVGAGNKVSFDGGDPVTISGGIIRVPVGSTTSGFVTNPFTGDVSAGGFRLTDLADAVDGADAVSAGFVGAMIVDAVGALNLDSVLTAGNDAGGLAIINLADPTDPQDAATKAYVDAAALAGSPETYTETNVTPDRSYDATASTLDEVMAVLGTLIGDLRTRGVLA